MNIDGDLIMLVGNIGDDDQRIDLANYTEFRVLGNVNNGRFEANGRDLTIDIDGSLDSPDRHF